MSYKLEKPFTDVERAYFVCEHQGLNYYENDNCIIMYANTEKIVNGEAVDRTQDDDYKQNIYNDKIQREINSYYEYLYRNDGSGCGAGAVTRLQGANALGATAIVTKLTNEIQTRHQTLVTNCNAIVKE